MRVSALAEKAVYGVLTPDVVEEICNRRILAADLLSRCNEQSTAHAAKMVMSTVESIRDELLGIIE